MLELREAQLTAVSHIVSESVLLLADVGAGKTATVLNALRRRRLIYGRKRTLVLGTKRICDTVWDTEIQTWAPEFSYESVAGKNATERFLMMMDERIDIIGLNFENLIWAAEVFKDDLHVFFPQLVIDESSKLENPSSKSFKAIRPLLPYFEWRLPMTGTPRANHLHDLWGSLYLADLGVSLGEHKQAFLQNFFIPVQRAVGVDWIPRAHAEEIIKDRCIGRVYRMPFEWHPPVEMDVQIPLNIHVKHIQKEIDKQMKESGEAIIKGITYGRDGHRNATKMLQLSSGYVYDDNKITTFIHMDKLNTLKEIINEAHGEPVMVVFQFDHERDAILELLPQARLLDDDNTLKAWNNGDIEVLLAHPKSCGYGLNAQFSGCDLQVWFTPTTDAEYYTQTIGRLNRPGNPKTIRVMRLIMQGTKDRTAYMVVAARQKGENATLESFL